MILTRRDFLKLGSAALLTTAMSKYYPFQAEPQEQAILWQGSSRYPRVALTYDDCYSIQKLQQLESILGKHPDVRITLFPVGRMFKENDAKDPGIWKRYYKRGHEIGYHSFDHTNQEVVSNEYSVADFDHWLEDLREVLGFEPVVRFARPPFGNTSPSFLHMCAVRGQVPTMWSTGWGGGTEDVVNYTVPKIKNGDIVLLHFRAEDMATSEQALPELEARGIQAVTMSRLYLDFVKGKNQPEGCYSDTPPSLTQTCID
jgi:peptidoglycan/xylan/chitin deacetylase (PgdA/CDA1 family)